MHLREVDANLLVTLDALLVDASVTRAAERLGRSASAISHALAKLREIFADELFVRAGQKLVPTAKALELAPTVHVILAGMESLLRPNKPFDPSRFDRAISRSPRAKPASSSCCSRSASGSRPQAPSVRVGLDAVASRGEYRRAAQRTLPFRHRHRGRAAAGARHPRAQAVRRHARHARAARAIPLAKRKAEGRACSPPRTISR